MTAEPLSADPPDRLREELLSALGGYREDHPLALFSIDRRTKDLAGLRIIDPDFAGTPRTRRSAPVWACLNGREALRRKLDYLLLLTPEEAHDRSAPVPEIAADDAPVRTDRNAETMRRTRSGRSVFATVVWSPGSAPRAPFTGGFSFDYPPGAPDLDGTLHEGPGAPLLEAGPASASLPPEAIDPGLFSAEELLRDERGGLFKFPTAEAAREAAFAEAERRLARYAALHPESASNDGAGGADAAGAPALAAA